MKFLNIQPLVYCRNPVSIGFDYIHSFLDRMKESYGLDLDPDFQRGHVWSQETKIKFVEFVLRGGQFPAICFNSPVFGGEMKSRKCDLQDTVVLVDGKQRLTAILDFIDNKLPVFDGNFLHDFEDSHILLRRCDITYRVNTLQTRKELLTWYLEMNEGNVPHSAEELNRVKELIRNS